MALFTNLLAWPTGRLATPRQQAWPEDVNNLDRPADPKRVEAFEGQSLQGLRDKLSRVTKFSSEEFKAHPYRREITRVLMGLEVVARHDTSSDHNRIDPGSESVEAARLFVRGASRSYPMLWRQQILDKDIRAYQAQLSTRLPPIWRERACDEQLLTQVDPRFALWYLSLTFEDLPALRSIKVFQDVADAVMRQEPAVGAQGRLTLLYPGAGHHLAPLVTAMRLMDREVIHEADFIFTEIDPSHIAKAIGLLEAATQSRLIEQFTVGRRVLYKGEPGFEQTIEITYQGRPIRITYSINRSGEKCYRPEDLERANLVVIHDPGVGNIRTSAELLAEMLLDTTGFHVPNSRWLIMEGRGGGTTPYDDLQFPEKAGQQHLSGPYGHCGLKSPGDTTLNDDPPSETIACLYQTGRLLRLDDPALFDVALEYNDPEAMSHAFLAHP